MIFPDLTRLISPKKIAIIGASERIRSHARSTYENIVERSDFNKENVYLVNPKRETLFGETCYKKIAELHEFQVDVAIILVKAELVAEAVEECAKANIPFALIMSAGFSEVGKDGEKAQEDLEAVISKYDIRVYGPNCPGLTDINGRLGMTFSSGYAFDTLGGSIGLVTQGGGIGRTVLQGQKRGIGFGYFFSPGNEIDLELSDFIYHMLHDPSINVITVVAEGFKNGEKFRKVAELALKKNKPIVILKIGKSELGRKAALSHTGALAGSDQVFDALCKQYGIIRVDDVDELLETSALLVRGGIKSNGEVAIVTGSGGAGSLAADLIGQENIKLATLGDKTIEKLKEILPSFASVGNPIDLTASFLEHPTLHRDSIDAILEDGGVDIIIEPINANYGQATEGLCEALVEIQKNTNKLVVPIWMSSMNEGGYETLEQGNLVPFRSIKNAISAVKNYTSYIKFVKEHSASELYEHTKSARDDFGNVIKVDGLLNEYESKKIMSNIGIATVKEKLVTSKGNALLAGEEIGYPVVLKIVSDDVPHKTEAGGVKLNITSSGELEKAFDEILASVNDYNPSANIQGLLVSEMAVDGVEMILGLKDDAQFGKVVVIGMGGIYAELLNDIEIGMCPVDKEYALKMISRLKTSPMLEGYRNTPKRDIEELAQAIVNLSILGANNDEIEEVDINPLLVGVDGKGVKALDALIVPARKMDEDNSLDQLEAVRK